MNLDDELKNDEEILLGDGTEETVPRDLTCEDTVFDIAFHPKQNYLVLGRVSGLIDVYEYRRNDARIRDCIRQHKGGIRGIEFSEDGKYLVTVGSDRHMKVLDCDRQTTIVDIGPDEGSAAVDNANSLDDGDPTSTLSRKKGGKRAGGADAGQLLRKHKVGKSSTRHIGASPHEEPLSSVNICSDTLISVGDDDGKISIWDMRTRTPAHVYHEHGDYVSQMLFFSEVDTLVATSGDTCISAYSLRAGKLFDCSDPRKDELSSMTFIGATNDIICGTPSGKLPIFKFGSWARPFDMHESHPKEADGLIAYNDNIFLTGACDGAVRVIQHYPTRSLLCHLGGHDRRRFAINRIRIDRERRMIAYCGEERFVQFQDIEFLSDEQQLDNLRSKAEQRHMPTIRKVQEENGTGGNDDDNNNAEWEDDDSDDDDSDEDSDFTSDSDDEEDEENDNEDAAEENDDDDEENNEDRFKKNRNAKSQNARVVQEKQQNILDQEERELSRQEKRERVAAAKWLKTAQKEKIDFKRERGKKRVRGFWSDLA